MRGTGEYPEETQGQKEERLHLEDERDSYRAEQDIEDRNAKKGAMDWMTEEWLREVEAQKHFAWSAFRTKVEEGDKSAEEWELFWLEWVARAAAQNVAKWLFSPCKEHHLNNSTPPLRIDCYICRKAIEQEVGLDGFTVPDSESIGTISDNVLTMEDRHIAQCSGRSRGRGWRNA